MRVAISENVYEPGLVQHRHAHGESTMTLILAGALEEHVGRTHEYARPFSVVIKPADTEHANRVSGAGARTLQIRLPKGALPDEPRILGSWRWEHAGPLARRFVQVFAAYRTRGPGFDDTLLDFLAALRPVQLGNGGAAPVWLNRVREEIDDALPMVVRVEALAQCAGVHPVYLARQFRRFFGCNVTAYIARRRAQIAASYLAGAGPTLSGIAYRAGYSDQSHFCRGFRAVTGLTPRAYRHLTTEV